MNFADRVERVEPSATIAISSLASELEAAGADVVDLSVGEPDFPTPEGVVEAGKAAIDAGHTGYTPSNGVPELRAAIAERLRGEGVDCEAGNVVVTPGAKQALFEATQALVDDGDEVVLLDPAWVSYEAMVELAGGEPVRVDLTPHDFRLEPALPALGDAVTDDTELLVVNSPANPTGAVFSDAALAGVRDLAVDHDVTVVSDEIYGEIAYGVDPTSLAALDGMGDRTVTIDGFSKAYAMTGWRLGYLAGPEPLVDRVGKVHSHSVTCAANFVQRRGSRRSGTPTAPSTGWSRRSGSGGTCWSTSSPSAASTCPSRTAPSTRCSPSTPTTRRGPSARWRRPTSPPSPGARSARPATPGSRTRRARSASARGSSGWPTRGCCRGGSAGAFIRSRPNR